MELFPEFKEEKSVPANKAPLADRMRPRSFENFLGQDHLLGKDAALRKLIEHDSGISFILWGPPGSGKTTLAQILARVTQSAFFEISAVSSGVADIRKVISSARKNLKSLGKRSVLFIDEIHRFNKAQQDAILPDIENGTLRLVGSTTENPSLEVIPALRSRCQIFRLNYLSAESIRAIMDRALADSAAGLAEFPVTISEDAFNLIIHFANGDARRALNVLEASCFLAMEETGDSAEISVDRVRSVIQKSAVLYEKGGTEHYDHASAFQKSLRGSDPDASIYWLAKMLAGGEDPRFIVRRLVVCAAEDVGLADPQALVIAMAAAQAVDYLGLPEARIPLSQAVLYVARAPKDNTAVSAIDKAMGDIEQKGLSFPVPDHLKDAHYRDAKKYGYGVDYKYPHDYPGNYVEQNYLPDEMEGVQYLPEKWRLDRKS